MPYEVMEQRGVSTSPRLREEIHPATERQFGLWKSNSVPDRQNDGERFSYLSKGSWTSEKYQPNPQSNFSAVMPSLSPSRKTVMRGGTQWESSLFSSSFSDLFGRKLRLLRNEVLSSQSAVTVASHHEEEEPFESLEEIEAQTIGNLLPNEDDLFAGVVGEVGHNARASNEGDFDDFDLFSSGGGMELEGEVLPSAYQRNSNGQRGGDDLVVGEQEIPSRTLFVQNINSKVEDSALKALFEQYGDIHTLYTACKSSGFVMVSYYDIRAAQNAMRALQDKSLRQRKLNVHYSVLRAKPSEEKINQGTLLVENLDPSVLKDEVRQIFGVYGEIKEIRETTYENSQTFVEFFDVRSAEAALRGLNGSYIAGKLINLEPRLPEDARHCMQYGQNGAKVRLPLNSFYNFSSARMAKLSSAMIPSSFMDSESIPVLHNPVRSPVNSSIEPHWSFSVPIGWPSSARTISMGKPTGPQEPDNSFDETKIGNQGMPILNPHSFPEHHDNFANVNPYESSRAFAEMVSNDPKMHEAFMARTIRGAGSDGHQMGFHGGVLGSSVNESSLQCGIWNSANSQQQQLPTAMIWPHSPSNVSSIPSQRLPPVSTFPRAPSLQVNASSTVHHHIGSAPANSPFWDRRHAYMAGSPESSNFQLGGSHGIVGFPGTSPSHPMEIASRNIFAHVSGNCMDANAANAVLRSPQQMSHLFPGRNPVISMPGSFDSPSEHFRNLSHRRNDSSSSNADRKQYELDVDRILRGEDRRTTLMIKNIPNKYTSKMLLAAIDEHCRGSYDFIYLPIDFKNKCNVGYAFINLTDPQKIVPFHKAFSGKKWEKFNSEKVASLAYARIQGKSALVAHFQNSSLMNEDKRCRPILFHTDGPNAGDQEPFPMGTNIRSRQGKPRSSITDNSSQGNSFVPENREEAPNGNDSSSKDSN